MIFYEGKVPPPLFTFSHSMLITRIARRSHSSQTIGECEHGLYYDLDMKTCFLILGFTGFTGFF